MIILLVIAGAAVGAPVLGGVLLSLAIRHEDAALSLSRRPAGVMQAAARRLVGFHGDGITATGRGGAGARPGPGPAGWPADGDWADGDWPADGDWRELPPLAARR